MTIHKEGYKIIFFTMLILAVANIVMFQFTPELIANIFLIISLVFFILVVQFFRNPTRNTIINDKHIIAPADGKVVVIEEVFENVVIEDVLEDEYFHEKRKQISIFMSPLNVHVNRNPISGEVKYAKYHPGKYLVAWHPKSSTENERTTVVIENNKTAILFRQIAGAVARRIVMYSKKGQYANQGEDMGFIKFGSRIDIFVPTDCKINVNINEKTIGGETIIATLE